MKLTAQLTALREKTRGLSRAERARHCCDLAKQLEKTGEYDSACEALSEFWPERDGHLNLNDLDEATKAMLFLRVGALSDRKSTRLNSSHVRISYAVFCLKKKKNR